MTYSTKLKHVLIPIVCLGTLGTCGFMVAFPISLTDMLVVALIVGLTSLYYLIKYIKETYLSYRQRCRAEYSEINDNNDGDDGCEELYRRYYLMCSFLLKCV